MYTPKHFEEIRIDVMHELMRAHPLATLVTLTTDGLDANHIPLHLVAGPTEHGTLVGHIARSNPMLEQMNRDVDVMAIFQGPQAYISPSWYETKAQTGKVVPTWNYAVVHAHGKLMVRDDPAWVRRQVEMLTQAMEGRFDSPWAVADAPADFTEKLMQSIVGIEIDIARLHGKWKVSQNQPPANRQGVIDGLLAESGSTGTALAQLMKSRE